MTTIALVSLPPSTPLVLLISRAILILLSLSLPPLLYETLRNSLQDEAVVVCPIHIHTLLIGVIDQASPFSATSIPLSHSIRIVAVVAL